MSKIIFATGNPNKIDEISRLNSGFSFLSLFDVDIKEDIPETGNTFRANALQKAMYVFERNRIPTLAEDSGLVINALNGAPGIYSARYAGEEKNHKKNMIKVLAELNTQFDRTAYYQATICYIDENGHIHYFEGKCQGRISDEMKGEGGFGYDPIFIPEGHEKTFGELPNSTKDEISHRKQAFTLFTHHLTQR